MPTATFPEIFNGLLSRLSLQMRVQNLKSVSLPVTEILGTPPKIGQSLDTPTLPFLQNFSWGFVRIDPVNVPAKFEVRSFIHSRDNGDWSFGWGLQTPNLREWEAVGGRGLHRSNER